MITAFITHAGPDIHHIDLYRLREPGEAARLDIAGTLQTAAALIEWPERLGSNSLPTEHLAIHLQSPEQVPSRAAMCPAPRHLSKACKLHHIQHSCT